MIESMNGEEKRVGEAAIDKFRSSTMAKLAVGMNLLIDEDDIMGGDKDF